MLGSITVSTLLFMSYFVTYSVNPWPQNQGQYAPTGQCPNTAYSDVMASMPDCQPRETLVKLDLPNDEMIEEVLPSHVLVPRCSGVCYEGNNFHKCVPEDGGRSTQNFQVIFTRRNHQGSGQSIMQCSSINVEIHTSCKCGCDVASSTCNSNQMYDNYYCKCRCQNYDERRQCLQQRRTKYWNEDNCQCLCLPSQWKECSTGYVYDPVETCECRPEIMEPMVYYGNMGIIIPLIVFLLLFISTTIFLGYKLRQISRSAGTLNSHRYQEGTMLKEENMLNLTMPSNSQMIRIPSVEIQVDNTNVDDSEAIQSLNDPSNID